MYDHLREGFAKINGANGPTNVKVKVHLHLCGSIDQGH